MRRLRRRWSPEEKAALHQRIVALGQQRGNQSAIANELGISPKQVSEVLRLHGIVYRPGTHAPEQVPPPLRRVVLDLAEVFDEVIQPRLEAYEREAIQRRERG